MLEDWGKKMREDGGTDFKTLSESSRAFVLCVSLVLALSLRMIF